MEDRSLEVPRYIPGQQNFQADNASSHGTDFDCYHRCKLWSFIQHKQALQEYWKQDEHIAELESRQVHEWLPEIMLCNFRTRTFPLEHWLIAPDDLLERACGETDNQPL